MTIPGRTLMFFYRVQQKGRKFYNVWEQWNLGTCGMPGGSIFPTPFGMFTTSSGTFLAPNGTAPPPTPWFPYSLFLALPFPWIDPQQKLATSAGGNSGSSRSFEEW